MSLRLSQILRHLSSSPLLSRGAVATTNSSLSSLTARSTMAAPSAAMHNASRPIHTAACLIIGDEVLGGKACFYPEEPLAQSYETKREGEMQKKTVTQTN